MKLDYKTLVMVSVLVSMFSMIHFYIFYRFNVWLTLGFGWKFYLFGMFVGGCSFIFLIWHPLPIKMLYHAAACWFGFAIFAAMVVATGEILAKMTPLKYDHLAISSLLIAICISGFSIFKNAAGREIIHVELNSSKIETRIRIALIADTHISGFHDNAYFAAIVNEINAQAPDMVCICGDFADGDTHYSAIAPLNEIKSPVYLVMGNHEVWNNHNGKVEKLLSRTKAEILHQSNIMGVQLIGVHFNNRQHGLKKALNHFMIDSKDYNILLYHEPKEVEAAQEAGIDLMLSGHTHGGQIFPWNYITKMAYTYLKGHYLYKGMQIYVSQGTGVWGPPMRLGSTNEITVIDLKPDNLVGNSNTHKNKTPEY